MSAAAPSDQSSGDGEDSEGPDRPAGRRGKFCNAVTGDGILSTSRRPREPNEVLGVARNATPAQIHSAYLRLALLHHPDRIRNPDDAAKVAACARFAEIGAAYELLTAASTRAGQEQQEVRVQQHAADAAAGGPPPAPPPSVRRLDQPFQYDPFSVFDDFFGTGERWPRARDGGGGRRRPPPFGDLSFTDPFRLFREIFGPGFIPGDDEDDGNDSDDGDDCPWPGGILPEFTEAYAADPKLWGNAMVVGIPGDAAYGGSLQHPVHPALIGSSVRAQPPNQQGGGLVLKPSLSVATDAQYSFVSAAAAVRDVPYANGRTVAMCTSTSIINGCRVTKTVCETLNPDGSRNTTIDVSGDGLMEEEMLQRRPDLLDDIVVNARVPAPPPPWVIPQTRVTTQHWRSDSQAHQDGGSSRGIQQEVRTTANLQGLDASNMASEPSLTRLRIAPFERGDPGSTPSSKKKTRYSLGGSPDITGSNEGINKKRKYE
mmetsp:Transcript_13707/g.40087  ORF Transcript_13707/g.40087 Transcript_13707/m.40087 type:complete len:486 (-) Transcript_13707:200-1657(-)